MTKYIDGLSIATTTSLAWTAGETKTTEKKTSAFKMTTGIPLAPNDAYILEVFKPSGNRAGSLTTYIYNVSLIDGVNSQDVLSATIVNETASDASAVARSFPLRGLFYGSEDQIKLGMKFSVNQTASVKTCYARLVRTAMA